MLLRRYRLCHEVCGIAIIRNASPCPPYKGSQIFRIVFVERPIIWIRTDQRIQSLCRHDVAYLAKSLDRKPMRKDLDQKCTRRRVPRIRLRTPIRQRRICSCIRRRSVYRLRPQRPHKRCRGIRRKIRFTRDAKFRTISDVILGVLPIRRRDERIPNRAPIGRHNRTQVSNLYAMLIPIGQFLLILKIYRRKRCAIRIKRYIRIKPNQLAPVEAKRKVERIKLDKWRSRPYRRRIGLAVVFGPTRSL